MRKEVLFEMKSPYRDDFKIHGYWFGEGRKTLAIIGAMRGDEIQQQYICAKMVSVLKDIEAKGHIAPRRSILVIPSCNPFSMNVNKRFWAMDGTDINRMFPGYDKGETTQRIAAALFEHIKGFKYGIQMASFYMPGDFVPHVRMLKTGYEDVESAVMFGLPFVTIRQPLPYDTTLLNYNWQIWGCNAFSLYAGQTNSIADETSAQSVAAMLRFMQRKRIIFGHRDKSLAYESELFDESELHNVIASHAGLFHRLCHVGQYVDEGTVLAEIIDPYENIVLEEVKAPVSGIVFFAHNRPLALEHSILFRVLSNDK